MHSASLYLAAVLIWGSTWFAIKFQLGVVAPEVSLLYRFALASAIFLRAPIQPQVVVGALIGIAGIAAIFWSEVSSVEQSSDSWKGL